MTTTDAKKRGRNQSTPQKILSAGLATATCVGLVGVLGARAMEANAAASDTVDLQVDTQPIAAEATTPTGLTQADLDAYAQQLETERAQLDAYRAKLVKTAAKLRKAAATQAKSITPAVRTQQVSVPATKSKPRVKAVPKAAKPPKAAAAPKPASAPRPQSNTKGS